MLVPIKWLREYTEINMPVQTWVDGMVLSGTNLETVDYWDKNIENVVVGKILKIEPHPNASKLVVCQVEVGQAAPVQIVTGAANMKEGNKVVVALDNSKVPGPLHGKAKNDGGEVIKAGELRGVPSAGMMCGCTELGFPDKIAPMRDREGLWLLDDDCFVPGMPIVEALGVEEPTVDFEITPNRPDCLSMLGIARESAATFGGSFRYPETECTKVSPEKSADYIQVEIRKPQLCPRYCCRVIKDIKIEQSPWWMQRSLMLAGMRPINNIVDISNYVMLEYGQPMHAFDISTVRGGKIVVDTARAGDKFTTLDGTERELNENILMINDAEGPLAIAGIMGGLNSEITGDTRMVLVESANFNGDSIRKSSIALHHRTEASGRFEKGIDPNLAKDACDRFCYLVEKLGAGVVLTGDVDVYPSPAQPVVTKIRASRMNKLMGITLTIPQMCEYLNGLEIKTAVDGDVITCTAPTIRQDLNIEEDYVEELSRMYGYDKLPVTIPRSSNVSGQTAHMSYRKLAKDALLGMGVTELMTYSFMSPKSIDKMNIPEDSDYSKFVRLINPLGEDTSVMRTTIIPNVLQVMYTNYSRNIPAVRFFELGNTFINMPSEEETMLPVEKDKLAIGLYGDGESFFTMKGILMQLFDRIGIKGVACTAKKDDPRFHPGRCAELFTAGRKIGIFGQLHPDVAEKFGLDREVYAAELEFDLLYDIADVSCRYEALPRFPAMARDFAMVVREEVLVGDLEKEIKATAGELLEDVRLFDVYRGAPVLPGHKSVAFTLVYRAKDRTLTDTEVNEINAGVLASLKASHEAVLREM